MQNQKTKLKFFLFLLAIFAFSFLVFSFSRPSGGDRASVLDAFGSCLAGKGVTMYGAYWCSHCQNEKKAFGDSFRYVPYVECTKDPKKCLEKGIEAYPTWIFPDGYSPTGSPVKGKRLVGEQGLAKLSSESGCQLDN